MFSYDVLKDEKLALAKRKQRSVSKAVEFCGRGGFTGIDTVIRIKPCEEDAGITFVRTDLPTQERIAATLDNVKSTPRCTILGNVATSIQTVEHLLSVLGALQIDNVVVEVNGPELPIMDGSAKPFFDKIAGCRCEQSKDIPIFMLDKPISFSCDQTFLLALPSHELRFSYLLSYPNHPVLNSQFYSLVLNEETYETEIAPSRTFSLYEEVAYLVDKGLLKGASLDHGVVFQADKVLNPEGLRFKNEPVRHKILDLIGDLKLIGFSIQAHFISVRSGHFANVAFARQLKEHLIGNGLS